MNTMKRLGKNIVKARKVSGVSRRSLAKQTDVCHITLRNYERGIYSPNVPTLFLICRALNVPVAKMLEGCE